MLPVSVETVLQTSDHIAYFFLFFGFLDSDQEWVAGSVIALQGSSAVLVL